MHTLNIALLHFVTELEGKDVEDLFTAVLSPSTSQPPPPQVPHPHGPGSLPATPGTSMPHPNAGTSLITTAAHMYVFGEFPSSISPLTSCVQGIPCFPGCQ